MPKKRSLNLLLFALFLVAATNCSKQTTLPVSTTLPAYDISLLAVTANSFNTSEQTTNARAIQMVGDSLLFVHSRGNNMVFSYLLERKGDIRSATYYQSFSAENYIGSTAQDKNGHGLFVRQDDLKKMWLFNRTEIWEFELLEAGNISTAVYSDYLDLAEYVERGHGIFFHPDGTNLYVDDRNKELVHQFTLMTPWSIDGFNTHVSLDVAAYQEAIRAVTFHPDGQDMYLLDTELQLVQHFRLQHAWQIETAVFHQQKSISLSNPRSFTWNSTGTAAYIMNTDDGVIYEFVISE